MIYFIRHAESEYNAKEAQISGKYGPDYMKTE
jgi:broad specificity phosphatase PhoE